MATPFKNLYTSTFINDFAVLSVKVNPSFKADDFAQAVLDQSWETLELKQRMRRISTAFITHSNLKTKEVLLLIPSIKNELMQSSFPHNGIEFMFLPDIIEQIGLDHVTDSIKIMEDLTEFITCEFAVRPFIIKHQDSMMSQMMTWSRNANHHVRRLSSEGCRPRLPWAMALPVFKKDPEPILPILQNLKNDPSEYVRKSVANNLNDIAKDHPKLVMNLAKDWTGENANINWIIKHGLRTLLKSNYPGVMRHFGYEPSGSFAIRHFKLTKSSIKKGDTLSFSFQLENNKSNQCLIRLEYAIYFRLSNETKSKKVFKISERYLKPKEEISINKNHSFREITTRTYYSGEHEVAIIVCGEEKAKSTFSLI